ncbi:MAG: baseplate J/gp47 family protein [Candidatus Accumulibacter sp.]|jgi:uncharacterized phage protein gp47/JayE|nr:baseplate J/gp47 family protein [Accumulibacter sp.]
MPFNRPTLKTLIDRAISEINARLPGADARLAMSNLNVLAHVSGAGAHGLYGFIEWLSKQIIIDTAETEYIERWASVWGLIRLPASPATGRATFTGAVGATIPAGTELSRNDGAIYRTVEGVTLSSGVAEIALVAALAGAEGNLSGTAEFSLVDPIQNADSKALVTPAGLTGGADIESDESLRARLLARIQQPPYGGAAHDYIAWTLEVPGVTRAWCYPEEMGSGTVTVRFVRDNDAYLIPDPGEAAAVQAYIDARRPVTAHLYVVAPIPVPVDFEVSVSPDTPSVRAAVEAELRDCLIREAVPEGGAGEGRIRVSHLREAISLASGETDHVLHSPDADLALTLGQMAVFGSISWI